MIFLFSTYAVQEFFQVIAQPHLPLKYNDPSFNYKGFVEGNIVDTNTKRKQPK